MRKNSYESSKSTNINSKYGCINPTKLNKIENKKYWRAELVMVKRHHQKMELYQPMLMQNDRLCGTFER